MRAATLCLGASAALVVICLILLAYSTSSIAACRAAEVEASGWAARSGEAPPGGVPECGGQEAFRQIVVSVGVGAFAGLVGFGFLARRGIAAD